MTDKSCSAYVPIEKSHLPAPPTNLVQTVLQRQLDQESDVENQRSECIETLLNKFQQAITSEHPTWSTITDLRVKIPVSQIFFNQCHRYFDIGLNLDGKADKTFKTQCLPRLRVRVKLIRLEPGLIWRYVHIKFDLDWQHGLKVGSMVKLQDLKSSGDPLLPAIVLDISPNREYFLIHFQGRSHQYDESVHYLSERFKPYLSDLGKKENWMSAEEARVINGELKRDELGQKLRRSPRFQRLRWYENSELILLERNLDKSVMGCSYFRTENEIIVGKATGIVRPNREVYVFPLVPYRYFTNPRPEVKNFYNRIDVLISEIDGVTATPD
jgi:hypothetical protein